MKKLLFANPDNFEVHEVEVTEEFHSVATNIFLISKLEKPTDWWKDNIKMITPAFVRETGDQFTFGVLTNSNTKYKVIIEELK